MTIHIFCLDSSSLVDTKTHLANLSVHTEMRIYFYNYWNGQRASQLCLIPHTQATLSRWKIAFSSNYFVLALSHSYCIKNSHIGCLWGSKGTTCLLRRPGIIKGENWYFFWWNVVLLVIRISRIALFHPRNAANALNAVRVRRIVYLNQGAAALRWKGWMVGADKGNILIADKDSSPSPAAAKIWTQATKISGDGRR